MPVCGMKPKVDCQGRLRTSAGSAGLGPDEVRMQAVVDRAAVAGGWIAAGAVEKGVVDRGQGSGVETHQVGDDSADALLLVVEHDWGAAFGANAEFERAVWICGVEGDTLQADLVFDDQVTMVEEDYVGIGLAGDVFADGAMADVFVDGVGIGAGFDVSATAGIFHSFVLCG